MTTFADLTKVPIGTRVIFAWALTLDGVPAGATGRVTDNDLTGVTIAMHVALDDPLFSFPPVRIAPKLPGLTGLAETAPVDVIEIAPVAGTDVPLTTSRARA